MRSGLVYLEAYRVHGSFCFVFSNVFCFVFSNDDSCCTVVWEKQTQEKVPTTTGLRKEDSSLDTVGGGGMMVDVVKMD